LPPFNYQEPVLDTISIRPARPGDTDTIVRFNVEMARDSESLELAPEMVRQGVEASLRSPERGKYFLAEKSGSVVGQIRVTHEWSDWNNSYYWWIQNVYVEPESRRNGVYTALHGHVRDLARSAGACGLLLYVDRENTSAQEVYNRLGMESSHYLIFEQERI
jgi:GNAT superfamily N-acetyltransferase|tara:strand:- start:132 stop:617 length:486 start_codon:yes stop_codon:yes gene_type:complete